MFKFSHVMFNPKPEPPEEFGLASFDTQPPPDPRQMGLLLPAVQA